MLARTLVAAAIVIASSTTAAAQARPSRPIVGVAFGGGSARGFAHVGVLRWLEEHRIPVDLVAGTSMGGLVGGAFASGMTSAELATLLAGTDWDEMFGASAYRYKTVRRKQDAHAYPSRIELQVRRGISLPSALNNGQQVDFLLARIASRYSGLASFDSLPTPFRCVAVDLRSGTPVVLARGSLARAMRATMSLPGVFPPVLDGEQVLVDGGALNNVPADVVRAMGATVVIAVDVSAPSDSERVRQSLFRLVTSTMDAMSRANTRRALKSADIVIAPDLESYNSGDWRRAAELAEAGYAAAEAQRSDLLRLAVEEAAWARYLEARRARQRAATPRITSIVVHGASPGDERTVREPLAWQIGQSLDVGRVEQALLRLGGLDRYLSVGWDLAPEGDAAVLVVRVRRRERAPPLLMTRFTVQNRTSDVFAAQLASRVLFYDMPWQASEMRADLALGTASHLAAELRHPLWGAPLFAALSAALAADRIDFTARDALVAQYSEKRRFAQLDVGAELSHDAEVRAGVRVGRYDAHVVVGNPGLPSLSGAEVQLRSHGVYDSQNSVIVPSSGLRVTGTARYVAQAPDSPDLPGSRTNDGLVQAELEASQFWSFGHRAERLFVVGAGGTSFGMRPLITDQFVLGTPWRLDAFSAGERRGDHLATLTGGWLHAIGRLPDILGGPVFVGGWLETGSAFDDMDDATLDAQVGIGAIAETLLGPAIVGYSVGSGAQRFYFGFGGVFR